MAMMIVTDCNVTGTKNVAGVLDQEIKECSECSGDGKTQCDES
jgi:hypothetical protein